MFPQPPPGQGPIDPRGATGAPMPPPPYQQMPPMPPMMPFPPMYPPPPRQGGGWAKSILITLATTIFGISLTLNIYLLLYTGLMGGGMSTAVNTTVLQDGALDQTIAVVPVRGIITDQTYAQFDRWMRAIEDDKHVKAIVLDVDTPGGEVAASDQIHRRIEEYKKDKNIKVIVSMGGYATSGGYYVSANADHIFAQPTTWTGNIGVRLDRLNIAKLGEKYGIEDNSLHATGSDFKTAGSMWKPESPQERAYLTGLIDDAYRIFKERIVKGRGDRLKASIETIASGKVFTADEAKQFGLIDGIKYPQDVYTFAAQTAGLSNPRIVRYSRPPSLFESLGAESSLKVGVDGVKLDRTALDDLLRPRLMYHWNGR